MKSIIIDTDEEILLNYISICLAVDNYGKTIA